MPPELQHLFQRTEDLLDETEAVLQDARLNVMRSRILLAQLQGLHPSLREKFARLHAAPGESMARPVGK
jgi:hypothetical protein